MPTEKSAFTVASVIPTKPIQYSRVLTIVVSKNNETHFERRARGPRPYEQSSVKGKVSD
ncbi:hypothetical protein JT359_14490 [Candidatus Poribacteria bacterium]|nr:hypothetical protein [Candidatus Poribacteria bacterium]